MKYLSSKRSMVWTGLITRVDVPGQEVRSARSRGVSHRWVTPQYFKTMGIPLRQGRDIDDADTADRPWVAVVSASFAERYWPGQDPIGKTFRHLDRTRTVVGVVGDVKVRGSTLAKISSDIEARLADGWLKQPQVAVRVTERLNREVSVLGQVTLSE